MATAHGLFTGINAQKDPSRHFHCIAIGLLCSYLVRLIDSCLQHWTTWNTTCLINYWSRPPLYAIIVNWKRPQSMRIYRALPVSIRTPVYVLHSSYTSLHSLNVAHSSCFEICLYWYFLVICLIISIIFSTYLFIRFDYLLDTFLLILSGKKHLFLTLFWNISFRVS